MRIIFIKCEQLEGDFFIQASQFYKQMICGVRTEDGVQRSSTVFLNKDKSNYKAFGSNSTNIKEVFSGIWDDIDE